MAKVISTVRDPALSLWQSCLHRVLSRKEEPRKEASGLASSVEHPVMEDASVAAWEHAGSHDGELPPSLSQKASVCARLLARMALARFRGDLVEARRLESQVRFASCDPLWLESVLEYERALLLHRQPFYRRHDSLGDFVLSDLPDEATVAVLADWGTGMPDAQALLEQIATFAPHAVIHLGDIYYSGTPHEVRAHFLDVFARVFGSRWPRVLSLSGNHDRYSGGEGYRVLLEALGQPASYFCLRNDDWQLLAMDTGLHDNDPGTVVSNLTYLDAQEALWHRDKIVNAGGRRTIMLSHHQLFSAAGVGADDQGRPLAVNPHLYTAFADLLGQVDAWLWGHEHNLILFDSYVGLARGRCIGSGAVPILVNSDPYGINPDLVPPPGQDPPPINLDVQLSHNGQFYGHGYALLTLRGRAAQIDYYQLMMDDSAGTLLYSEQIG